MAKKHEVHCPQCGKHLGWHDGKTATPLTVICRGCQRLIVYKPESGESSVRSIPPRKCSSGKKFL